MITVILTIHVLIVLALIGVVLLQRSEGGALGMGGAGSGGGFMTGRGAANVLTRTTSILAAVFFVTSISLAIFADRGETDQQVIEGLTGEAARDPNAPTTAEDLLNTLGAGDDNESAASDAGAELPEGLGEAPSTNAPTSIEEALQALGAEPIDAAPEDQPTPSVDAEPDAGSEDPEAPADEEPPQ